MAEMTSKKQVSNVVVLVVAMVLMANYFVSCENTNIGDVESDDDDRHHHNDGINVKESHDLAPHNDDINVKENHDLAPHPHRNNGNRKMEAGGDHQIRPNEKCAWDICNFYGEPCEGGCLCLPVFVLVYGVCAGACC